MLTLALSWFIWRPSQAAVKPTKAWPSGDRLSAAMSWKDMAPRTMTAATTMATSPQRKEGFRQCVLLLHFHNCGDFLPSEEIFTRTGMVSDGEMLTFFRLITGVRT
eukprot:scaffold10678_cov38-Prasinocladus_malaysianus.AAC.1